MALEDIPRLRCGRGIDSIWATLHWPSTAHEEQCEHCRTARTRLRRLSEATRSLRERDLHNPALDPRPGIADAIMAAARGEVRRGRWLLLRSAANGTTEISEQALGSLIRSAAAAIPGVHSRRCRVEIRSATAGAATDAGPRLNVSLRVAAAPGIVIPRTAEALRHEISLAIPAGVGIGAGTVNITVEDLYDV